jgi:hypothetical protein
MGNTQMKHILLRLHPGLLVFCASLLLPGFVTDSLAGVRSAHQSAQPTFFVKLNAKKKTFYKDEYIGFSVVKRAERPEGVQFSRCSFGGIGSKSQVLRNGEMVKEFKLSPISMLAVSKIRGVTYNGFGDGTFPFDFVPELDVNVKDNYQIRVICGDEVSALSEPFHVDTWFEPVDGLQVGLRPLKTVYKLGEPILVEATMRNVGSRPRLCPVPTADDGYMKAFWRFSVSNTLRDPRPILDDSDLYTRRLKTLLPGESQAATFSLSDLLLVDENGATEFGSKVGKYVISATVYFHDDSPRKYAANLWRGEMASNAFEIVVR